jgi:hypothetical protein
VDRFPLLGKLFADGAYQGLQFRHAQAKRTSRIAPATRWRSCTSPPYA